MTSVLVLQQVGYYAAILPLALCFLLFCFHRDPIPDAWLLSAVFAISFLADTVMRHLAVIGGNNWWVGYFVYPVQFGILISVVAQHRRVRILLLALLLGLALTSAALMLMFVLHNKKLMIPPEAVVRVAAGIMCAVLVIGVPNLSRFKWPVLLYGVGCIPGIWGMVAIPRTDPEWLWPWSAYQVVRLAAVGWLAYAVLQPHLLEVTDGPRTTQAGGAPVLDTDRFGLRPLGGGRRHVMAAPKR